MSGEVMEHQERPYAVFEADANICVVPAGVRITVCIMAVKRAVSAECYR